MNYKDMVELSVKDWDGKPFNAYISDTYNDEQLVPVRIVGYINGKWCSETGVYWNHAFPLSLNKPKPKRMTNRQLSLWVAKGNGEWKTDGGNYVMTHYTYLADRANLPVGDAVKVRTCDSEEWVDPTTDLIEGTK